MVKVCDFGSALVAPSDSAQMPLGRSARGSTRYACPEMCCIHTLTTEPANAKLLVPVACEREALLQCGYDSMAADVWSFGIMTYVLVCGKLPFRAAAAYSRTFRNFVRATQPHALRDAVLCPASKVWLEDAALQRQAKQGATPGILEWKWPEHVSQSLVELLTACLRVRADERPSMEQLKSFDWFTQPLRPYDPSAPLGSTVVARDIQMPWRPPASLRTSCSTATDDGSPMASPTSAVPTTHTTATTSMVSANSSNTNCQQQQAQTTASTPKRTSATSTSLKGWPVSRSSRSLHTAAITSDHSAGTGTGGGGRLPAISSSSQSSTTSTIQGQSAAAGSSSSAPPSGLSPIKCREEQEKQAGAGGFSSPLPRLVDSERATAPSSSLQRAARPCTSNVDSGPLGVATRSCAASADTDQEPIANTSSMLATVSAAAHSTTGFSSTMFSIESALSPLQLEHPSEPLCEN